MSGGRTADVRPPPTSSVHRRTARHCIPTPFQSGQIGCGAPLRISFLFWKGILKSLGVECMPSEAAPQKHPAKDGGPMAGVGAVECPSLIWLGTAGSIWLGTTGSFWLAAGSAAHAAVQMAARVRASTLRRRLTRLATFQIREGH